MRARIRLWMVSAETDQLTPEHQPGPSTRRPEPHLVAIRSENWDKPSREAGMSTKDATHHPDSAQHDAPTPADSCSQSSLHAQPHRQLRYADPAHDSPAGEPAALHNASGRRTRSGQSATMTPTSAQPRITREWFIPPLIWKNNPSSGGFTALSRERSHAEWQTLVAADEPVVT